MATVGRVLVAMLLLACGPQIAAAHDLTPFQEAGRSHVIHEDVSPAGAEPINVETYVPAACTGKPCPLLIAIHGLERNAETARDNWVEAAERYDLLIAAPHFDKERFPTRLFQQGGVRDETDPARWLYASIERFFDRALASGRVEGTGYVLFGHSAGAQFVHRMALLMPTARFTTAISANAGYYTLPLREGAGGFAYPYSLVGTPATDASLSAALGKPLLVMLGERDDDAAHPQLNHSRGAEAQGPNRLARGRHFMAAATAEAARLKVEARWREILVPGIGHDSRRMAAAAAEALFAGR
jgi:pimeloyl-ACP methyl ester carboxylesterase